MKRANDTRATWQNIVDLFIIFDKIKGMCLTEDEYFLIIDACALESGGSRISLLRGFRTVPLKALQQTHRKTGMELCDFCVFR